MKRTLKEIQKALIDLDAYDDECKEAIEHLNEAVDRIDEHPIPSNRREVPEPEPDHSLSGRLKELEGQLAEAVADHPTLSIAVGRIANALSVAGL